MPTLQLLSLQCTATEDWLGGDEAYIKVGGNKVWPNDGSNAIQINNGENRSLATVAPITFNTEVNVELFDEDNPAVGDPDDALGSFPVRANEIGLGTRSQQFTGQGANYTLFYIVT